MKSVSISRAKTFRACPLLYDYTYVDKFVPVDQKPIYVTLKGLVLHETFEELLKYENYEGENPKLPYRKADEDLIKKILEENRSKNKVPEDEAKNFHLELGVKRWLDFKHNYLDKNGHIMYSEKEYKQLLFGETETITILDLLEDCGDGNYIIYDYKTPKTADVSRYKDQLVLYAYVMAIVKGLIQPDSTEFEKVANHFKLYVFFPLIWDDKKSEADQATNYETCLKPLSFTAKDVETVITHLKETCDEIDAFDFTKPAEVLQPSKLSFQCNWCAFCGSAPQDIVSSKGKKFEGCPITHFCGKPAINESFKPVEPYTKVTESAE